MCYKILTHNDGKDITIALPLSTETLFLTFSPRRYKNQRLFCRIDNAEGHLVTGGFRWYGRKTSIRQMDMMVADGGRDTASIEIEAHTAMLAWENQDTEPDDGTIRNWLARMGL